MSDKLFSLIDGSRKGLHETRDMSTISSCRLVTDEEAEKIREAWNRKKEEKKLREELKIKIETMSLDQLKKINSLYF